ncbi:hypothetical protein [Shewanella sp.]|uniref:hypothetical protein n=1 Tax=Shewanella sp. TaxID=50422 RepID=UPI003A9840A3
MLVSLVIAEAICVAQTQYRCSLWNESREPPASVAVCFDALAVDEHLLRVVLLVVVLVLALWRKQERQLALAFFWFIKALIFDFTG